MTEAEYMALSLTARQAIWLTNGLTEIGFPLVPTLLCDNQGSIDLSKDSRMHKQSKHIDVHYHFIRETIEKNKVSVSYIPSNLNIADIFTKLLGKPQFLSFCS